MADHHLKDDDPQLGRMVVQAGVAAVPIVGGPLAVVLAETWPTRRRQNAVEFINGVADDVEELAFEMGELQERLASEDVAEVFYIAGRTAQVSSHVATRRRCRNAVVNAIRQPENAAMNLRMVRLLDELTPAHFSLLELLRDPPAHDGYSEQVANVQMGGMKEPAARALDYSEDFGTAPALVDI